MSTNGTPIHVLLVSEAGEAGRLRELLDADGPTPFHISYIPDSELAIERLSSFEADVLLLDIGSKQLERRAFVEEIRAATPDMPMVVLSELDDEDLAIQALELGAQDFLVKVRLDRAVLARSLRYSIERHRLRKTLQSLSLTDDLTGLQNRRGFLTLAEQHLRTIFRKGAALLVYVDLDDLKLINDTQGHLEGNRALIVTANLLRACFRQSDIIGRMGGDEFCTLMTDAGEDSIPPVHQRVRQRVDSINALWSWRFQLSVSIGIAEVSSTNQSSLEELIRVADANMYEGKRNKPLSSSTSPDAKQSTVV